MVKIININKNLKDELVNIRWWKQMDEESFRGKEYVSLNFSDSKINEKFNIKGSQLELEYIVSTSKKNFISYSKVSSIYEVDKKTLFKIAKENGFMVMNLPEELDFEKDVTILVNKLISFDLVVIPLDKQILIESVEPMEINFQEKKLLVEEIQ